MSKTYRETGVKTIYVGSNIVVFLVRDLEQFADVSDIFYNVSDYRPWENFPRESAFIIYDLDYCYYDNDTNELTFSSSSVNYYKFTPDFDNPILNTVCGKDTLKQFFERIDSMDMYLTKCDIDMSVTDFRFLTNMLSTSFFIKDFCREVYPNFLIGLNNFYNSKDSKDSNGRIVIAKVLCAYYYQEIKRKIISKYPLDNDDWYETVLFLKSTTMDDEVETLLDKVDYRTSEFIDMASEIVLDMDICHQSSYVFSKEAYNAVLMQLLDCCDTIDDRALIFNTEMKLALSNSAIPCNASIRLATLQSKYDINFVGALIMVMFRELKPDVLIADGTVITLPLTMPRIERHNVNITLLSSFIFSKFLENFNGNSLAFSEECFEDLRPFIEYAFRLWLYKCRFKLAWAHTFSLKDVMRDNISIQLQENGSSILITYHCKLDKLSWDIAKVRL